MHKIAADVDQKLQESAANAFGSTKPAMPSFGLRPNSQASYTDFLTQPVGHPAPGSPAKPQSAVPAKNNPAPVAKPTAAPPTSTKQPAAPVKQQAGAAKPTPAPATNTSPSTPAANSAVPEPSKTTQPAATPAQRTTARPPVTPKPYKTASPQDAARNKMWNKVRQFNQPSGGSASPRGAAQNAPAVQPQQPQSAAAPPAKSAATAPKPAARSTKPVGGPADSKQYAAARDRNGTVRYFELKRLPNGRVVLGSQMTNDEFGKISDNAQVQVYNGSRPTDQYISGVGAKQQYLGIKQQRPMTQREQVEDLAMKNAYAQGGAVGDMNQNTRDAVNLDRKLERYEQSRPGMKRITQPVRRTVLNNAQQRERRDI